MCECICEQILFRVWMDVWATTLDEMRKLSSISEIPAANVAHLLRRTNTNFVSNYNFCQSIWLYWSTEPRKQHFLTIRWKFEWKRHQLAMLIETKFQTVGWSVQKVSVHRLNGILVRCLNFMFKARLEAFFEFSICSNTLMKELHINCNQIPSNKYHLEHCKRSNSRQ